MKFSKIFNLILDNCAYIIVSFVIVASIASDLKLSDNEKFYSAVKKQDVKVCESINFGWIKAECIKDFDKNHPNSKGVDYYLYITFNLFLILFFILFMKGIKKLISGNLYYIERNFDGPMDFFHRISDATTKGTYMLEVKKYLFFSVIVLIGNTIIGIFVMLRFM
jgi:hypothetical protein